MFGGAGAPLRSAELEASGITLVRASLEAGETRERQSRVVRRGAAAEDQRSLPRTWRRPDASTTGKISAREKTSSPFCQCEGEGSVKHDTDMPITVP